MKLKIALCVLVLAGALAVPALAETQNIRVSGEIDAYWFLRNDYDLSKGNDVSIISPGATAGVAGEDSADWANYQMSITKVNIDADLTDNVSTHVTVANERDWNANVVEGTTARAGNTDGTTNNDEYDLILTTGYAQMKEIFYAPLTLSIGRQPLWFGRGFIIGNNSVSWDVHGAIVANEYSANTNFDAVRATLDFNPWTIDFVWSNIDANSVNTTRHGDDITLYGANVNYKFSSYNAVAEGYVFIKEDFGTAGTGAETTHQLDNNVYTVGGRAQFDPISAVTLGLEGAWQGGQYETATLGRTGREAWALDAFGEYRFESNWSPKARVEYVYYSGDESPNDNADEFGGWNLMYRGKFYTAIRDFQEVVYGTARANDQGASTNQHMIQLYGSLEPMADLMLEGSYSHFWSAENNQSPAAVTGTFLSDDIGDEVDLVLTYDYTEDVSFGLLAGWFFPGDLYKNDSATSSSTATDLVSSVKVTF